MLHKLRTFLTPSFILLLGTCCFLVAFISLKVPPLIVDFDRSLESEEKSAELFLTFTAQTALTSKNYREIAPLVRNVSSHPYIQGVIVADSSNRVVASAWRGEEMSETDAVTKMTHGSWQRWPVKGANAVNGYVVVSFDNAWQPYLKNELVSVSVIVAVGVLLLAMLVSIDARDRLSRKMATLKRATAQIANGDYDVRISAEGKGPIANLANNLKKMALDLDDFTRKLRTSEERFELAANGSNEGIWDWDIPTNKLYLSPRFGKILGYRERDLPRMFTAWERLIHPDDRSSVSAAFEEHITHGKPFHCEFRFKTKSDDWLWMLGRGKAVRDARGTATRMAGSFSDISQQKATERALEREKERLQVTLQSIADSVIATNIMGEIVYMNSAAERLTGWTQGDAYKQAATAVLDILNEFGKSSIASLLQAGLRKQGKATDLGQAELLSRNGEKHIVEHNLAPLRDKKDRVIGSVIVVHDVTDRYKLMRRLSHQAVHDPLTQLINRTGFELRLNKALKVKAEDEPVEHAICYMDLDQFKIVNDTCGHSAGDELLRQIAVQLKKHVRQGDTLARLGGDEFGLLLEACPLTKALEITEKIRQSVESFRFSWEDKSFSVGVSIGVSPFKADPGNSVATILSSVDQACYIAKSKGRNRIHTYQPGDNESSRWHNEMQWVPHIHRALDDGQFVLFAQPIVPIGDRPEEGEHHEILLRMKGANGDLISPGSFLPAAERYDLMGTLDRWVVEHAVDLLALAIGSNHELSKSTFGINISGAVLSDNSLLAYVKEMLEAYKLPPSLLCFEITETVAIANFTHANRFVNELKEIGCRFALDDFGSGFASFSYLKTLPVDYLKIDGSFVRHLTKNQVDHTMVDIINQLGHVMGLKTIAEFVDSEESLEALKKLGVDYAQGFHLGRPIPLQDVCYGAGTEASLQINSV